MVGKPDVLGGGRGDGLGRAGPEPDERDGRFLGGFKLGPKSAVVVERSNHAERRNVPVGGGHDCLGKIHGPFL